MHEASVACITPLQESQMIFSDSPQQSLQDKQYENLPHKDSTKLRQVCKLVHRNVLIF